MAYAACDDCGTKLSGGRCPNCHEELVIYEDQYEFLPDKISDEFMAKVNEQKSKQR